MKKIQLLLKVYMYLHFIALLNYFRLAKEIDKIDYYSEDKIMDDIDITIRNIHGIRCGLYSPQMVSK